MITIQNKGVMDLRAITTFGVCAKEIDDPIGKFGTGLKYAIAVMLREGCQVSLWLGAKEYEFGTDKQTFRNVKYDAITVRKATSKKKPTILPYSTSYGKNWDLWMAYRELLANAMDEGSFNVKLGTAEWNGDDTTTWVIQGKKFEELYGEKIYLEGTPLHKLDGLEIYDDFGSGGWIYVNGFRAHKLSKPAYYDYNLVGDIKLTEERTISNMSQAYIAMSKAIAKCEIPSLIRQLLTADQRWFESTIDYHWWSTKPGECYNQVVERLISSRTSFNSSGRSVYHRDHPKDLPPNVIQLETIPMEQRRKLWAALAFWSKLGVEVPKSVVFVTDEEKSSHKHGKVYISERVLGYDMRTISGIVYKLYSKTLPKVGDVKEMDVVVDTLVDFGERLLGVSTRRKSA